MIKSAAWSQAHLRNYVSHDNCQGAFDTTKSASTDSAACREAATAAVHGSAACSTASHPGIHRCLQYQKKQQSNTWLALLCHSDPNKQHLVPKTFGKGYVRKQMAGSLQYSGQSIDHCATAAHELQDAAYVQYCALVARFSSLPATK